RRSLCYFIRASVSGYQDMSSFVIHAGLNKEKIYEALEAIKEELSNIKITKDELQKAKDNIRGRMILKMENAPVHLNFLLGQEILGQDIKGLEAKLKELDKVTLKQLHDLAQKIIRWPQANLAIIGPFADKKRFLDMLKNKSNKNK
ncbi:insulinase family protein, partial [bacterium]|nr:insulinase family protein [bacterium]